MNRMFDVTVYATATERKLKLICPYECSVFISKADTALSSITMCWL